jgi:hypothetical protein
VKLGSALDDTSRHGGELNVCFAPDAREGWAQSLVRLLLAAAVAVAVFGMARPAHADLLIPANSVVNLASGTVDLACTDVIVAGTLQLASGSIVNARHVTIQPGGTIDGGSGILTLGGNWTNTGQFVPGTSAIRFRDLCSLASATIAGNTTFSTASLVTASGKNYVFAIGSTQVVNNLLEIAGTAALPIQFRSSAASQVAFINLLTSGVQQIQHVGVTDVWATGQWLAPTLTNEGGGGNARRWFGRSNPVPGVASPIPTLSEGLQILLAALLAAMGAWMSRRRRSTPQDFNRPRQ